MTIIKPNSIAGITSITAQGDVINLYKSDGTLAGLQLNGVNFNTTSGVSTFNNVTVGGTITYQDVAHVDSVGIITAQQGLQVLANGLNVTGVSTFNSNVAIGTDSAAGRLNIVGDVSGLIARFSGNSDGVLQIRNDDSNVVEINASGSTDSLVFGAGSGTERVRITSDGKLGVGMVPSVFFDITSPENDIVRFIGPNSGNVTIRNDTSNEVHFHTGNSDALIFGTNGENERLRITSTGDFVVAAGATFGASVGVVTYYGDGSQLSGISVGLTTESASPNNTITHLDLTNAQDHKLIVSGITTISVTGGTEADSHTIRIQNSGISTVGFSTYFLFPSGAAPTLPTADGAISLISFTVHRVGAAGTQLLAGASVNFS